MWRSWPALGRSASASIDAQFRTIDDQISVIIFNECSELRAGVVNYEGQRTPGIRSFQITRVSSSFPSTQRQVKYAAGGTVKFSSTRYIYPNLLVHS